MRFTAYIILMFCISLVLYMFGFRGWGMVDALGQPLTYQTILASAANNAFTANGLVTFGLAALGTIFLTLLGGFTAVYFIPLLLLYVVMVYFVLPTSFIYNSSCAGCVAMIPEPIKLPLFVLLNILLVLSMLNFTRGGA